MKKGMHAVIGLLAIFLIGFIGIADFGAISNIELNDNSLSDSQSAQTLQDGTSIETKGFTISSDSKSGVLDPIRIRQSGYQTTEGKRGRTDTGSNTQSDIAIDDANGWFMNSTSIDVWNLQRLYGINGTFDAGTDPWTNYTKGGGGSSTQLASYNSAEKYIECKNVGEYDSHPTFGVSYTHYSGEIGFSQVIYNVPNVLDFRLEFDFRYATGPLDPQDNDSLGDIGVFWQLEKDLAIIEAWYTQMQLLSSHDGWHHISHDFDPIPAAWSEFTISLGLYFPGNVVVDNDTDYDDDPLREYDGMENMQNVTLQLDNIVFTSIASPTPESVDLTFHAGSFSVPISNAGTASISNPSFWTVDPLNVEVTSNTSVIFSYTVTSLFHRYINSSWTTDLSKDGVQYSATAGQSAQLFLYTYITPSTEYSAFTVDLLYPDDWENATVLDPLTNDITGLCSISPGRIHIPNSEVSRSGWWEMNLQSPNYARNVSLQVQDEYTEQWSENSLFRPGNNTRAQIEIGTALNIPTAGSPVNITWILPNSTTWSYDSISAMNNGVVNSSQWILGGTNTSAGQWEVTVLWTNGTEIAYDYAVFDMYHSASITPRESLVETDAGLLITNILYYVDEDTGKFILDASATIAANWTGSTVYFEADPIHNWWQADFDTSLVEAGQHVVVVNASIPYYDDITCQFIIVSTHRTTFQLTSVGGLPTETGLHETLTVYMEYQYLNGTGVTGAAMSMSFTGPSGGLLLLGQSSTLPGNYSIDLTSSISGIYTVTITASKPYHHNKTGSFTLIVGETGTQLTVLNGTADFLDMGGTYRLVLEYANSTGDGIDAADVAVIAVTPSSGLGYSMVSYEGNGFYSFVLTPSTAGTYTLILRANLTNHVTQIVSFTLTASNIATLLTIDSPGATVAVLESITVQLTLLDDYSNGVSGATITVLNLPAGLNVLPDDLTGGFYNLSITGSIPGTYQLAIRASKTNYLNSTVGFTIIVAGYSSIFTVMNGTADYMTYGNSYNLVLRYTNGTGFGLDGASIDVIDRIPSVGLGDLPAVDEGSGYYSITITPTTSDIFSILIKANLSVYTTQIVSFSLTVREISTILTLDASGATIAVDQNYIVQLTFRDESLNGLPGATVLVLNPPVGMGYSVSEISGGQYALTLTPSMIGTYEFAIRAALSNYLNSTVGFTLVVRTIPTELRIVEGLESDSTFFTEEYSLTLVYVRTDTGQNISSADLTISTLPAEGLTVFLSKVDDLYFLGFAAESIGKWQVFFTANKTDHVSGFVEFELEVLPVAIEINDIEGLTAVEGVQNVLSLWLLESETRNPVSGAIIEYQLISETGPGEIQQMAEDGGDPGHYTASFQMPSFLSTTYVRIYVTIENYEMDTDYYEVELVPILSEIEALNRTIRDYSLFIAIIGIAAISYGGRRSYIRKQRIRNIEAMLVKRRFDDIKSLLGVIVLHKYTGIPVYSKMMKEGLDESLVSGFVSAISTFRGEFDVNQENWVVTPISDIIRTVATENLICAFVSLAPPSKSQELRMVEFAEAIGFVFDNMYTEAPATALDPGTEAQFDTFFDDIMDGRFLRDYKVSEIKSFPRKTKCIVERIHRIDDEDGFDLDELATEMTSCGFEEARVYAIIMDAIEMGNLVLTSIDEMRAKELAHTAEEESTIMEAEPEPEGLETIEEESMIMEAEPEPEDPEPTQEPKVSAKVDEPEISEEEMFLEDIESLLSEEDNRDE
ncbi:MAG: hypothetical protein ACFFEA_11025 [Candidatus Thorarchaeota archaeon]